MSLNYWQRCKKKITEMQIICSGADGIKVQLWEAITRYRGRISENGLVRTSTSCFEWKMVSVWSLFNFEPEAGRWEWRTFGLIKKRRIIFCLLKSILMVLWNRTKTVTAFVFLWAARDISCEAPSVREEAEEEVKSFGAWYKSRKQTNILALRIKNPMWNRRLCRNDTTPISDFTFIFNVIFVMCFVLGPRSTPFPIPFNICRCA